MHLELWELEEDLLLGQSFADLTLKYGSSMEMDLVAIGKNLWNPQESRVKKKEIM